MFNMTWHQKSAWHNPVVKTDWKWLIALAWGKRRVSSRAAKGTKAYPADLGGTLSIWFAWLRKNAFRSEVKVVISGDPEGGHGALYYQELLEKAEVARLQGIKNDMALRIDDLQKKRVEARKNKDFELADAIRDEIVQAGFQVQDAALGGGVL
jgi:hypothetical protein